MTRLHSSVQPCSGVDLVRWYRLDGADSPEELGEFYADLALRMIGTRC